jgi:hypothetical protein
LICSPVDYFLLEFGLRLAGVRCKFIHEISIEDDLPWILILGIEGIFDKFKLLAEVLIHQLQPVEELGVDDMELTEKDIEFLEVDGPFAA